MKYKLDLKDVEFVAFKRGSGPGGQHKNKTATSIRATHKPTGIRVEACNERSQLSNKKLAIEMLEGKLYALEQEKIAKEKSESYSSKSDANFSSQIRTYRLCGNVQCTTDHRTNVVHPNTQAVLNGDIGRFLNAQLRK